MSKLAEDTLATRTESVTMGKGEPPAIDMGVNANTVLTSAVAFIVVVELFIVFRKRCQVHNR
jgi:hypothetical protein